MSSPSSSRLHTWGPPLVAALVTAAATVGVGVASDRVILGDNQPERLAAVIDTLQTRIDLMEDAASREGVRTEVLTEQIAVLEDSIRGLLVRLPPPPPPSDRVVEQEQIRVERVRCERASTDVDCTVDLTNMAFSDVSAVLATSIQNYGSTTA